MNRFFVEQEQIVDKKINILGDDVKHMSGALRLEIDDEVEIVCDNKVYLCKIRDISKKNIELDILGERAGKNEARTKITLYQGIAKGSKIDYIVQKGTEIGITEFVIVETGRSVVKISDDKKKSSKIDRWQKIADEAAKQSKRDILPKVRDIILFKDLLEEIKGKENVFIPYENDSGNKFKELIKAINSDEVSIIIGPEGGFEQSEVDKVIENGGHSITLGPRILRTETAGIVASSIVLYERDDI